MQTLVEGIDPFFADVTLAFVFYTLLMFLPVCLGLKQCFPLCLGGLWTFYCVCELYSFVLCAFPEPRPYEVTDCLFLVPSRFKDFFMS